MIIFNVNRVLVLLSGQLTFIFTVVKEYMLKIYAYHIIEILSNTKAQELLLLVSSEKKYGLSKIKDKTTFVKSLIGDVLIRTIIRNTIGIANNEINFVTNEFGKPFLKDYPDFHFNLSHSGIWVVCAVDNQPVGIDVQIIKPIDIEIAKRFFSEEEYLDILGKPDPEREDYFYRLWTLKESYIKAIGKGLSYSLKNVRFKITYDGTINSIGADQYYFKEYGLEENYKLSVCASNKKFPKKINLVDFHYITCQGKS